jgi:hypothetical protein
MSQSITDFISKFGGGTRTNRFRITGAIGGLNNRSTSFNDFHIRAATLPSAQVGAIPVNYRGRTVNYPGDRNYLPWQIVVLDENPNEKRVPGAKTIYGAFHDWQEKINAHATNKSESTRPDRHFSSSVWNVDQLDVNGAQTIRSFKLYNCWPIMVGPIELNMDQDNLLGSFAVTVVYSHYTFDNRR